MLDTELHISTSPPQFCGNLEITLLSLSWATVCEVHQWSACFQMCMFSVFQRLPFHVINRHSGRATGEANHRKKIALL